VLYEIKETYGVHMKFRQSMDSSGVFFPMTQEDIKWIIKIASFLFNNQWCLKH